MGAVEDMGDVWFVSHPFLFIEDVKIGQKAWKMSSDARGVRVSWPALDPHYIFSSAEKLSGQGKSAGGVRVADPHLTRTISPPHESGPGSNL